MQFNVQAGEILTWKGDGILVGLFEGATSLSGATAAIDQALGGLLSHQIEKNAIKGKLGTATVVHTLGRMPAARVGVMGLGKAGEFTLDRARQGAARGAKALRAAGAESIAISSQDAATQGLDPEAAGEALVEGIWLGLWQFDKYQTEKEPTVPPVAQVTLLVRDGSNLKLIEQGARRGQALAQATGLARDLANEPGNTITPTRLAEIARDVASKNGLEFYVIDRSKAKELGMGAFLGVAQGSDEPPAMIVLRYWGAGKEAAPGLGLVGKGLTFDSGGISLKPAEHMEDMKGDMCGGAAAIAAMQAIAELKPGINVTAIIPATENLPSGKAYKPGDILKASNGKTIEVVSTDAEGRLILADALVYATRTLKLSPVVDAATLTGAMMVSLGHFRTGVFSNDPSLAQLLFQIGEQTGEKNWTMPMDEEYREQIKSDWADIKNSAGRYGGAITAAWFLRHFVDTTPWAHLDIAGTTMISDGKERGYANKWGTGVPTRTFVKLALALAERKS